MSVRLHELQGNVLCGYGERFPQAAHLFCQIQDAGLARAWLARLAGHLTTATPWSGPPGDTLNVAFSFRGLRALGMPASDLDRLPAEFRDGMASRAARLHDHGDDAPGHWEAALGDGHADVMVSVHVPSTEPRHLRAAVLAARPGAGVHVLAVQETALLRSGREHFGFADGLAQPAIADPAAGPYHGHGTPPGGRRRHPVDRWPALAPGEFVTGYEDEDGVVAGGGTGILARDATYVVVRKLGQFVGAWERQLLRWAGGDPRAAERIGAQVMGRWRNGTPVASSPDAPEPGLDPRPDDLTPARRRQRFDALNDFGFGEDPEGRRCPLGAHVRRANPRDALGDGRLTRRHRIVRRGMPYGPEVEPADRLGEDDTTERGLFFVCFQASIARQFELIQGDWLRDGDAFALGSQADPVLCPGAPDGLILVGDRPRHLLVRHDRTVAVRGGGYYVMPSVPAVRALAGLDTR